MRDPSGPALIWYSKPRFNFQIIHSTIIRLSKIHNDESTKSPLSPQCTLKALRASFLQLSPSLKWTGSAVGTSRDDGTQRTLPDTAHPPLHTRGWAPAYYRHCGRAQRDTAGNVPVLSSSAVHSSCTSRGSPLADTALSHASGARLSGFGIALAIPVFDPELTSGFHATPNPASLCSTHFPSCLKRVRGVQTVET